MKSEELIARNNVENFETIPDKQMLKFICITHLKTLQRFSNYLQNNFVFGYGCGCDFCKEKKKITLEKIGEMQTAMAIYKEAGIE